MIARRYALTGVFFLLALLFITVFFSVPTQAQNSGSVPEFNPLPGVVAQNVLISDSKETSFAGSFTAINGEERSIGNLTFDYLILGPRPEAKLDELIADTAPEYARIPSGVSFALTAKEEKDIAFTTDQLPLLPRDNYRLRIQLKTLDDRHLGWADTDLTLGGSVPTFGLFTGGSVEVASTDPFTGEDRLSWAAVEGVNVNPQQEVTLTANITNKGSEKLTGAFTLTFHKALTQNTKPETVIGPQVTVESGQTIPVTMPFTAPKEPGVYEILGVIKNEGGVVVSSIMPYRLVVKGISASIIRATLDQTPSRVGESAIVSFSVVGAADRTTEVGGLIRIELLSEDIVVGSTDSVVSLSSVPTDGIATVALTQDVTDTLKLRVTLQDQEGNVLATSTSTFEVESDVLEQPTATITRSPIILASVAGGVLLLIVVAYLVWRFRKKQNLPPGNPTASTPVGAILLLLLTGGILLSVFVFGSSAWALSTSDSWQDSTGIHFRQVTDCRQARRANDCYVEHAYSTTVVNPIHNIKYSTNVTYDVAYTWYACQNGVTNADILVQKLQNGGAHVNSLSAFSSHAWQTIGQTSLAGGQGGIPRNFTGMTSFAGPYTNNISTIYTRVKSAISQNSFDVTIENHDFRWLTFVPPTATVDLAVSYNGGLPVQGPITVVPNSSVKLSWITANVSTCSASNGWSGARPTTGNELQGPLTQSATFTLTCVGTQGQSVSDSVVVNVPAVTTPTPTIPPTTQAQDCPANSPEVVVDPKSESGVRYTHAATDGNYRVEIFSPRGLRDGQYRNYTWANWPSDDNARHHGSSLFIIKNALPTFGTDTNSTTSSLGGSRVNNATASIDTLLLDPPYDNGRLRVADAARGADVDVPLKKGDYLTFIVSAVKGVGDAQGSYSQNTGALHVRVCLSPVSPSPTPNNSADLSLIMQAPSTISRDEQLHYSLKVTNGGPSTATDVVVTDPIPADLTFNAALSSSACKVAGSNVTCSLPSLTSNTSSLLSVAFNISQTLACKSDVRNKASVTSSTLDPSLANNTTPEVVTNVTCPQCTDGSDNDNDQRTDVADPACHQDFDVTKPYLPNKKSETDTQCTDKKDNDADQLIDENDPGCHVGNDISNPYVPADDTESGAAPFDPGDFRETE